MCQQRCRVVAIRVRTLRRILRERCENYVRGVPFYKLSSITRLTDEPGKAIIHGAQDDGMNSESLDRADALIVSAASFLFTS